MPNPKAPKQFTPTPPKRHPATGTPFPVKAPFRPSPKAGKFIVEEGAPYVEFGQAPRWNESEPDKNINAQPFAHVVDVDGNVQAFDVGEGDWSIQAPPGGRVVMNGEEFLGLVRVGDKVYGDRPRPPAPDVSAPTELEPPPTMAFGYETKPGDEATTMRGKLQQFMAGSLGQYFGVDNVPLTGNQLITASSLGLPAAAIGTFLGGPVGGAIGLVGGSALGYWLGGQQDPTKNSDTVNQALGVLNVPFETAEKVLGLVGQIGGALNPDLQYVQYDPNAKPPEGAVLTGKTVTGQNIYTVKRDLGTLADILSDPGAAWEAGSLLYESLPIDPRFFSRHPVLTGGGGPLGLTAGGGQFFENIAKNNLQEASPLNDPNSMFVDYDLPRVAGGMAAMVQLRRDLAAAPDEQAAKVVAYWRDHNTFQNLTPADYDAILAQKTGEVWEKARAEAKPWLIQAARDVFGAPGYIRDMAAGFSALDPLDAFAAVAPRLTAATAGGIGKMYASAGNLIAAEHWGDVSKAAAMVRQGGATSITQAYGNILMTKAFREGFDARRELNTLQKWIIGRDTLDLLEGKYQPPKNWVNGLFRLTPTSQARDLLERYASHMQSYLADALPLDADYPSAVHAFVQGLTRDPEATLARLPEAGRAALSLEGRLVRRLIDPVVTENYQKVWENTAAERGLVQTMAAAMQRPVADLLQAALADAAAPARLWADFIKVAPDEFKPRLTGAAPEFTAARFKTAAEMFVHDNVPFDLEHYRAAVMGELFKSAGNYVVKTMGLTKSPLIERISQAVKAMQSPLLLGFNLFYPIRNALNNEATMLARGSWGLTGMREIRDRYQRLGLSPVRLREAFGFAGDAKAAALDTGFWGDAALNAGNQVISDATRGSGPLESMRRSGQRVSESPLAVGTKWGQWFERAQSARTFDHGFMEWWSRAWRRGQGFDRMPPALEGALRAVDPKLPEYIYAAVESGYNLDEVLRKFTSDAPPVMAETYLSSLLNFPPEAVTAFRAAFGDSLNQKLAALSAKPTRQALRDLFGEFKERIEADANQKTAVEFETRAEEAALKTRLGQGLAVLELFDDLEGRLFDTYDEHLLALDSEWANLRTLGPVAREAGLRAMKVRAEQTWARYFDHEASLYEGVQRGLRTGGLAIGDGLTRGADARRLAIGQFWTDKNKVLDDFFGKANRADTDWAAVQTAIDARYQRLITDLYGKDGKDTGLQGALDDFLAESLRATDPALADQTRAWRAELRAAKRADMADMAEFRRHLRTLSDDGQRFAAWQAKRIERVQRLKEIYQRAIANNPAHTYTPKPPDAGAARLAELGDDVARAAEQAAPPEARGPARLTLETLTTADLTDRLARDLPVQVEQALQTTARHMLARIRERQAGQRLFLPGEAEVGGTVRVISDPSTYPAWYRALGELGRDKQAIENALGKIIESGGRDVDGKGQTVVKLVKAEAVKLLLNGDPETGTPPEPALLRALGIDPLTIVKAEDDWRAANATPLIGGLEPASWPPARYSGRAILNTASADYPVDVWGIAGVEDGARYFETSMGVQPEYNLYPPDAFTDRPLTDITAANVARLADALIAQGEPTPQEAANQFAADLVATLGEPLTPPVETPAPPEPAGRLVQPDIFGRTMTRNTVRAAIISAFKITPENADAMMSLLDARAGVWARTLAMRTGKTVGLNAWYKRTFAGLLYDSAGGDLFQLATPEGVRLRAARAALRAREAVPDSAWEILRDPRPSGEVSALLATLTADQRLALSEHWSAQEDLAYLNLEGKAFNLGQRRSGGNVAYPSLGKRRAAEAGVYLPTRAAREKGLKLYQTADLQTFLRKGSTEFLADGRAVIRGFRAADISTVVHEIGHVFRNDLADLLRETNDPRLRADWDTAAQYVGLSDGAAWNDLTARFRSGELAEGSADQARYVAAEEQFARAFEQYLREGVAPSAGLRRVFEQFKTWLNNIYRTLIGETELEVLTPELRGVFDRMLASEPGDAIKPPREDLPLPPDATPLVNPEFGFAFNESAAAMTGELFGRLNWTRGKRGLLNAVNKDARLAGRPTYLTLREVPLAEALTAIEKRATLPAQAVPPGQVVMTPDLHALQALGDTAGYARTLQEFANAEESQRAAVRTIKLLPPPTADSAYVAERDALLDALLSREPVAIALLARHPEIAREMLPDNAQPEIDRAYTGPALMEGPDGTRLPTLIADYAGEGPSGPRFQVTSFAETANDADLTPYTLAPGDVVEVHPATDDGELLTSAADGLPYPGRPALVVDANAETVVVKTVKGESERVPVETVTPMQFGLFDDAPIVERVNEQAQLQSAIDDLTAKIGDTAMQDTPAAEPAPEASTLEAVVAALPGPEYRAGDRVVLADGTHGAVLRVHTVTTGAVFGPAEISRSYYYTIKTDAGHEDFGHLTDMTRETGQAPTPAVMDPALGNDVMKPESLLETIQHLKRAVKEAENKLAGARTDKSRRLWNQKIGHETVQLQRAQGVWDEWAKRYPVEARRLQGDVTPPQETLYTPGGRVLLPDDSLGTVTEYVGVSATGPSYYVQPDIGGDVMHLVEKQLRPGPDTPAPVTNADLPADVHVTRNTAQNGIEIKFDNRPNEATLAALKRAGYRWSPRQKLHYRRGDTPANYAIALELAGAKPKAPAVVEAPRANRPPETFEIQRMGSAAFHADQPRVPPAALPSEVATDMARRLGRGEPHGTRDRSRFRAAGGGGRPDASAPDRGRQQLYRG